VLLVVVVFLCVRDRVWSTGRRVERPCCWEPLALDLGLIRERFVFVPCVRITVSVLGKNASYPISQTCHYRLFVLGKDAVVRFLKQKKVHACNFFNFLRVGSYEFSGPKPSEASLWALYKPQPSSITSTNLAQKQLISHHNERTTVCVLVPCMRDMHGVLYFCIARVNRVDFVIFYLSVFYLILILI
jgi:hypothetical protein